MKHTPGPWKVEDGGFVGGPIGFGRVCQTWNKFEEDFQNAEANARLIAAAPELYGALIKLNTLCGPHVGETLRAEVQAALAKAEGR
jgi:hypothetical protein